MNDNHINNIIYYLSDPLSRVMHVDYKERKTAILTRSLFTLRDPSCSIENAVKDATSKRSLSHTPDEEFFVVTQRGIVILI